MFEHEHIKFQVSLGQPRRVQKERENKTVSQNQGEMLFKYNTVRRKRSIERKEKEQQQCECSTQLFVLAGAVKEVVLETTVCCQRQTDE